MKRLLLFNCSNDLALASGMREYIAPKSIAAMEDALAALPYWWAEDGDAVIVSNSSYAHLCEEYFSSHNRNILFTSDEEGYNALCKRTAHTYYPTPWGWSRATAERYKRFGVPQELLPNTNKLDEMRNLSSREFAAEYIKEFLSSANYREQFAGEKTQFIRTLDNFDIQERTIFKSPWSSSGRGIFAADSLDAPSIRQKLSGFIKRQKGFLVDKFYDKRIDFALEYYISPSGETRFLGYSLFTAGINGYYGYNSIAPQESLRDAIVADGCSEALLDYLIETHRTLLQKRLSGKYSGCVGIDMLTTIENGKYKVHPCLEINLRMNIGILAIHIEKKITESIQGEHNLLPPYEKSNCFCAIVSRGRLFIGLKEQLKSVLQHTK